MRIFPAWLYGAVRGVANLSGSVLVPENAETHGICEVCRVKVEVDDALAHALVGLRAITAELERARAGIWDPMKGGG